MRISQSSLDKLIDTYCVYSFPIYEIPNDCLNFFTNEDSKYDDIFQAQLENNENMRILSLKEISYTPYGTIDNIDKNNKYNCSHLSINHKLTIDPHSYYDINDHTHKHDYYTIDQDK